MRPLPRAGAVLAAVLLVAGCSSSARPDDSDLAGWVGRQDHVAAATLVAYDDPSAGQYLAVRLDPGLPDATVEQVVHAVKAHLDPVSGPPGLQVDVDGFQSSVFPGLATDRMAGDQDLERALWLRADGRATGYADEYHSTTGTHPRVIAPAADVAQLALDYDAAVGRVYQVGHTESVESADGTTGVQWSTDTALRISADTVGEFARLQQAHPGTTGWLTQEGGWKASIDLDPAEVPLADVEAGTVVDASRFTELELGWGPARAPAADFARVFGDPGLRQVLTDLGGLDGVARIDDRAVVVRTGAAFTAVLAYLVAHGSDLDVDLQRTPVLYGFPTDPVFSADRSDPADIVAVDTAVADLPGIRQVQLADDSDGGTLTVGTDVTAAELRTVFTLLAALPTPYRSTDVFGAVPGASGHEDQVRLGTADATGFTRAPHAGVGALGPHPDLVDLVERTWEQVR